LVARAQATARRSPVCSVIECRLWWWVPARRYAL
jgi:hypothetical protein